MDFQAVFVNIIRYQLEFFLLRRYVALYSRIPKRKLSIWVTIVLHAICVLYAFIPYSSNLSLTFVIICLGYILIVTKQFWLKKIALWLSFELGSSLFVYMIMTLSTLLTSDHLIMTLNESYRYFKYIVSDMIIYIILSLIGTSRRFSNLSKSTSYRFYYYLISVLFIFTLSLVGLLCDPYWQQKPYFVLVAFSSVLLLIFTFVLLYNNIIATLEHSYQSDLEREKLRLENCYYAKTEESIKQLSRMRHDFKNHLIVIDGYLKEQKTESLQNYLKTLTEELSPYSTVCSNNVTVSAIVEAKKEKCKESGIDFTCALTFSHITVSDYPITIILGNLLDNAITAAMQTDSGHISLSVRDNESYLEIICQNNHNGEIIVREHSYLSTKKDDTQPHGLGLSCVKAVVDSMQGSMNLSHDSTTFTATVLLPNYE